MEFLEFIEYVPKIEKEKLLSTWAHLKMAPLERVLSFEEAYPSEKNPRKAAVMMLFYPKNNQTHLVLIVRNSYLGVHSSQIAFPGGKVELEDLSLQETALRETHEEIGVAPENIQVIKAFSEIYIPPSNFLVAPFMGIAHTELQFIQQFDEVAGIIEVSLVDFLDETNIVMKRMDTSYATDIEVPTFMINGHYVWGATAMMMSELKEVLKKVFKQ